MPRRTKSIKITDKKSEKAWLKNIGETTYKEKHLNKKKTILIICEGQTEELYFKSFPVVSCTVTSISVGQSKESLINYAIEYNKKEKFDQIWCVYDMDTNQIGKETSSFDNSIKKAESNKIKVAYSNDSFELWFCLHFNLIESKNKRDFYSKKIGEYLGINYTKIGKKQEFCKNIYSLINEIGCQKKAISNAKKLHKLVINDPPSKQNPVTLVYKLVEVLNDNMRK